MVKERYEECWRKGNLSLLLLVRGIVAMRDAAEACCFETAAPEFSAKVEVAGINEMGDPSKMWCSEDGKCWSNMDTNGFITVAIGWGC